ncbi:MAG: hypothetical protein J0L62_08635 [Bacteroidetes bacterium]|nr:hypothetical protein [Bacteroidota bacterium]
MMALLTLLLQQGAEGLSTGGLIFLSVCWGLCIIVMVASFWRIMKIGNKIEE